MSALLPQDLIYKVRCTALVLARHFFLVFLFLNSARAQVTPIYSPEDYRIAAEHLRDFFVMGTQHYSLLSSFPLNNAPHSRKNDGDYLANVGWDVGYSAMYKPIRDFEANSFVVFGSESAELPDAVYFHRAHFAKTWGPRAQWGLSGIYSPDQQIWGGGAEFQYLLNHSRYFFSSLRAQGSFIHSPDFFDAYAGGLTLTQTFKLGPTALFAGYDLYLGGIDFTSNPGEFDFGTMWYYSHLRGKIDWHFGVDAPLMLIPHTRLALVRRLGVDESWLLRVSVRIKDFVDLEVPEI